VHRVCNCGACYCNSVCLSGGHEFRTFDIETDLQGMCNVVNPYFCLGFLQVFFCECRVHRNAADDACNPLRSLLEGQSKNNAKH